MVVTNQQQLAQQSLKDFGPQYDGLDPEFAVKIKQMLDLSGGQIWINSGFRDEQRQVQLWNTKLAQVGGNEEEARKWVAKPASLGGGGSNHTAGLAVDLGGDLQLAHQLAAQVGLVFPMSWEPWHIEPPWARDKRGNKYSGGLTPDPATGKVPEDNLGSLHTQLVNFRQLIMGDGTPVTPEAQATNQQELAQQSNLTQGQTTGDVDPGQLYTLLRTNGLDPAHAAAFVAIAGRESGFKSGSHNPDRSTGDDSYGLFQVNLLGGMHSQYTPDMLTTAEGSARAAAEMYQSGGTRPWGPYKGQSWLAGTQGFWDLASKASGGAVTPEQIAALQNEGLQ